MNIRPLQDTGAPGTRGSWPAPRRASRIGRGFTLIELMVVLAIMAIVVSITVGAFKSLTDNNQRTACQANLVQVYQGLRLYMADENGQAPPYNPQAAAGQKNIGLWNLWTYPEPADVDKIAPILTATTAPYAPPTGRYLRSTKVLHCPADSEPSVDPTLRTNPAELYLTVGGVEKAAYNPDYLSYQMYAYDKNNGENLYSSSDQKTDPGYGSDILTLSTYLPERTTTTTDPQFRRQLRQPIASPPAGSLPYYKRPPLGSTIVTWCRHHRYTRDFDNVLFFDGSVQLIARAQDNFDANCNISTATPTLLGSLRVPRRTDCGE